MGLSSEEYRLGLYLFGIEGGPRLGDKRAQIRHVSQSSLALQAASTWGPTLGPAGWFLSQVGNSNSGSLDE